MLKPAIFSFGCCALFGGLAFGLSPSHWALHAIFVLSAIVFLATFSAWIAARIRDGIARDAASGQVPVDDAAGEAEHDAAP